MGESAQCLMSYWLVSAPADPTKDKTAQKCRAACSDIARIETWDLPDLKVGTLDSLMQLSDDLTKVDLQVEGVVHKIERDLADQLESKGDLTIDSMTPQAYAEKFNWEFGKFQLKSSLREMTEEIQKEVAKLDTTVKEQLNKYSNIKSSLAAIDRKASGNLMVKSLTDIVTKDMSIETETMTTVMVIVNRNAEKEWLSQYETMADYVVPRSAHKPIAEEGELRLYNPIVFRKCLDDFKVACRENRFTVWDFTYSEGDVQAGTDEKNKLMNEKDKVYGNCVRQCVTAYRVGYANWMHLKAIRMFVESVLRYGLPPNFQVMILLPNKGKKELAKLYESLGNAMAVSTGNEEGSTEEAFYSYVFLPLKSSANIAEV